MYSSYAPIKNRRHATNAAQRLTSYYSFLLFSFSLLLSNFLLKINLSQSFTKSLSFDISNTLSMIFSKVIAIRIAIGTCQLEERESSSTTGIYKIRPENRAIDTEDITPITVQLSVFFNLNITAISDAIHISMGNPKKLIFSLLVISFSKTPYQ